MFLLLLFTGGCAQHVEPPTAEEAADAARILGALEEADDSTIIRVFAEIDTRPHVRATRVSQQLKGQPAAVIEGLIRQLPGQDAEVLTRQQSGAFARGFRIRAGSILQEPMLHDDDAAHRSSRFAEDYIYQQLPDTLLWGRSARVLAIRARPGADQLVRLVHYYLDQGTVVAVYIELERQTLFFSEVTHYFVQMRPDSAAGWAAHHQYVATWLALPLREARRLTRAMTVLGSGSTLL